MSGGSQDRAASGAGAGAPAGGPQAQSSGQAWRSEDDYYLARLALRLGYLDEQGVYGALARQGQLLGAGQALTLGQLLLREGGLPPQALLHLQHEMARCYHRCPGCGIGNWHAPGPQPRQEPCRQCGGPVTIVAAGSSLSGSYVDNRLSAVDHGTQRFRQDPLQTSGEGPRLFANYILEQQLAKGGMGAIYRVRHVQSGVTCALKVLLAAEKASEGQIHRFKREAKAQIELGDHPNIVKIHDAGEWEGILYYAMDLVEGTDLGATTAAMSIKERVLCLTKVARAVHYAHEQGYLHRDLKPANVLVDRNHQPQVTDFGLAKNIGGDTHLTQEGAAMGTPFYMAPEQAVGDLEKMGPASDVYSLGVILYELICGAVPFRADSTIELYRMILELQPAPFAAHGVMEPDLELISFKAMEKDVTLRYASAREFAEDLERVLAGQKPSASSVTSAQRLSKTVEENRRSIGFLLGAALGGVVLLVVVALTAKLGLKSYREAKARTQLEESARLTAAALARGAELLAPEVALQEGQAEALRGLDEALARAAEIAAAQEPPSTYEQLLRAWRPALLARAEIALERGSGSGARRAAQCLERFAALASPKPKETELAQVLRVRVAWRLGAEDEARRLLSAPDFSSGPLAQRLKARALLRAGQIEQAQAAADALPKDPDDLLLRARCRLASADLQAAAKFAASAVKARPSLAPVWLDALCEAERYPEAFAFATTHLALNPNAVPVAERLFQVAAAQGRDHEALLALEAALRRRAGDPDLSALRLRLRARLGEDIAPALQEAADHPQLRLLRAQWALLAGQAAPAPGEDPVLAALLAARDAAAPLPPPTLALLQEAPHDRPPPPLLAHALCDLAQALALRGEAEPARAAALAAWRGLRDVDSALLGHALAASAERPLWVERTRTALVRECSNLQGPLSRALLFARWPAAYGADEATSAACAAAARPLWRARLLAGPNPIALHFMARVAGREAPPLPEGLPWAELLPTLPERATVPEAARAEALAAMKKASTLSRERGEEVVVATRAALAKDPWCYLALWELGVRRTRQEGPNSSAANLYTRRLRLRPARALATLWRFRKDWRGAFLSTNAVPVETQAAIAKGELPAPDLTQEDNDATRILVDCLGDLYPKDERPPWPKAESRTALRARIGDVVRRDPLYLGLLYYEALLFSRDDLSPLASRDLEVLQVLPSESGLNHLDQPVRFEDLLFRAWVRAPFDPRAGDLLTDIPGVEQGDKDTRISLLDWVQNDAPEALRKHPSWGAFVKRVRTE